MPAPKKEPANLSELTAAFKLSADLDVAGMDDVMGKVEFMSTGNIDLDEALGGGFPRGRSGIFSGFPASGKTTSALQTAVGEQQRIKREGTSEHILFVDYEHALDPGYATDLGIDYEHVCPDGLKSFLYMAPDVLEVGAEFILKAVAFGNIRLVIVDSLAAMTPEKELESDVTTGLEVALQARLLKQFGNKLNPLLDANNCSLIFMNHEKLAVAVGGPPSYGPPKTTSPGGTSPKFFASVMLLFKQAGQVKGKVYDHVHNEMVEKIVGYNVIVKVTKNKVGKPMTEATVRTRFGQGLDNFYSALQILKGVKLAYQTDKGWIGTNDPTLLPEGAKLNKDGNWQLQGEDKILNFADENPEFRELWIDRAKKVVSANRGRKAPVTADGSTAVPTDD